jgi:[protein-PII] uridylyltransferase
MRELFGATEAVFRGGRTADAAATFSRHLHAAADEARTVLITTEPEAEDWAGAMENAYFTAFSASEYLAHAALARRAASQGGAAASASIRQDRNAAEVIVAAHDRRGLFADLAVAIADFGANVVGARAFTSSKAEVLDLFFVQDAMGQPLGCDSPRALERLTAALVAAARGESTDATPHRGGDLGRAAAFTITPAVSVDNEASDEASVIEVSGRDRPGLLGAIARTLAEAGLSIQSAHIDNYGERAVDAFYCHGPDGGKLTGARSINALKAALNQALDEEPAEPAEGRPRLERARASIAR